MEAPHEYNYQRLGLKKFVIDYIIEGRERTCKEFAKTESAAKKKISKSFKGIKIEFTHVYIC